MLTLNSIYIHKKTGTEYELLHICKMQVDTVWCDAVIYKSTIDGNLYVRKIDDFSDKFTLNKTK